MADINHTFSNVVLSEALDLLHKENNPQNQNLVLDEIVMRAQFLTPVVLPERTEGTPTDAIQFQLIFTQDGRPFFPAFTDWDQLRKLCGPKDQKTVVLAFDNFAAMLAENPKVGGFVVNPLGEAPFTLERDFVAHLAKKKQELSGYSRQVIKKDTKVVFTDPKDYPQALVDAVRLAAASLDEVDNLYLRLMARAGQSQPSYLIIVDQSGDQDKVFRAIADAARPHLDGKFVDMVPYATEFGKAACKDTAPFFARKK